MKFPKHGGTARVKCGQGEHGHGFKKGPEGPTKGGKSHITGHSMKKAT
jgi:hypothetical protein